jgi:hypothetical protein
MKKILYILIGMFVFSIAAILVSNPTEAVSQQRTTHPDYSIPDSVMMIFRNSCLGCHGEGGNGMAMAMVNFSAWDTYSAKKQSNKASAICKAILKGGIPIPPPSTDHNTPGKVLSPEQTNIVRGWANSLNIT